MKINRTFFILVLVFYSIQLVFAAGRKAPPFEVYDFRQENIYSSDDFKNHPFTLLIFWQTYCGECLKSLKNVWTKNSEFRQDSVNVVSINYNNPQDIYPAMEISKGSPYPVYYDGNRFVVESYGATTNEFSAYIVSPEGMIVYVLDESLPDAGEVLHRKILALKQQSREGFFGNFEREEKPGMNRFEKRLTLTGEGRTRFLSVSSPNPLARGAYGEELVPGNTLKYYFVPDFNVSLTKDLQLGTIVRLTNVPDEFLFGAPDFYSNSIFSPYVKYRFSPGIASTIGYYKLQLSPLTLMRWDENDNPPGAGGVEGGCGACGGLYGGISTENLEILKPEIGLEGLRLEGGLGAVFQGTLFYARPVVGLDDCSLYRQHLLGGNLLTYFLQENSLEIRYLGTFEQSGRCDANNAESLKPPLKTDHLFSSEMKLLSFEPLTFSGEIAYFHRNLSAPAGAVFTLSENEKEGFAYLFQSGIETNLNSRIKFDIQAAFLSLDRDYLPSYKALSYVSNRRGFRFRTRFTLPQTGFILFYKSLKEIQSQTYLNARMSVKTFGLGGHRNWNFGGIPLKSYLYYSLERRSANESEFLIADENRHILTAGVSIELNHGYSFLLSLQNVRETVGSSSVHSTLFSIYNFVAF